MGKKEISAILVYGGAIAVISTLVYGKIIKKDAKIDNALMISSLAMVLGVTLGTSIKSMKA